MSHTKSGRVRLSRNKPSPPNAHACSPSSATSWCLTRKSPFLRFLSTCLAVAAISACARPIPRGDVPRVPSATPPIVLDAAALDASTSIPSAAAPSLPHLENCVLHAGNVQTNRVRQKLSDGTIGPATITSSCDFNAECVARHGKTSPTDGFADLECLDFKCTCKVNAIRQTPIVFSFTTTVSCSTQEIAQSLLIEHCMAGMSFVPARKPQGSK